MFSIKGEGRHLMVRLFLDDLPINMKFLVAFALAVACAHADVSHIVNPADQAAVVVKSVMDVQPEGFNYAYETSNGISANAEGVVQNVNSEYPSQVVRGAYSYTGTDGVKYEVTYTADENGFHAQGAHLPVAPPVPEDIQRSIEYLRTHAPEEVVHAAQVPVVAAKAVVSPVVNPVLTPTRAAATAGAFAQRSKPLGRF